MNFDDPGTSRRSAVPGPQGGGGGNQGRPGMSNPRKARKKKQRSVPQPYLALAPAPIAAPEGPERASPGLILPSTYVRGSPVPSAQRHYASNLLSPPTIMATSSSPVPRNNSSRNVRAQYSHQLVAPPNLLPGGRPASPLGRPALQQNHSSGRSVPRLNDFDPQGHQPQRPESPPSDAAPPRRRRRRRVVEVNQAASSPVASHEEGRAMVRRGASMRRRNVWEELDGEDPPPPFPFHSHSNARLPPSFAQTPELTHPLGLSVANPSDERLPPIPDSPPPSFAEALAQGSTPRPPGPEPLEQGGDTQHEEGDGRSGEHDDAEREVRRREGVHLQPPRARSDSSASAATSFNTAPSLSESESDTASVRSDRRAWQADIDAGYSLEERVRREEERRRRRLAQVAEPTSAQGQTFDEPPDDELRQRQQEGSSSTQTAARASAVEAASTSAHRTARRSTSTAGRSAQTASVRAESAADQRRTSVPAHGRSGSIASPADAMEDAEVSEGPTPRPRTQSTNTDSPEPRRQSKASVSEVGPPSHLQEERQTGKVRAMSSVSSARSGHDRQQGSISGTPRPASGAEPIRSGQPSTPAPGIRSDQNEAGTPIDLPNAANEDATPRSQQLDSVTRLELPDAVPLGRPDSRTQRLESVTRAEQPDFPTQTDRAVRAARSKEQTTATPSQKPGPAARHEDTAATAGTERPGTSTQPDRPTSATRSDRPDSAARSDRPTSTKSQRQDSATPSDRQQTGGSSDRPDSAVRRTQPDSETRPGLPESASPEQSVPSGQGRGKRQEGSRIRERESKLGSRAKAAESLAEQTNPSPLPSASDVPEPGVEPKEAKNATETLPEARAVRPNGAKRSATLDSIRSVGSQRTQKPPDRSPEIKSRKTASKSQAKLKSQSSRLETAQRVSEWAAASSRAATSSSSLPEEASGAADTEASPSADVIPVASPPVPPSSLRALKTLSMQAVRNEPISRNLKYSKSVSALPPLGGTPPPIPPRPPADYVDPFAAFVSPTASSSKEGAAATPEPAPSAPVTPVPERATFTPLASDIATPTPRSRTSPSPTPASSGAGEGKILGRPSIPSVSTAKAALLRPRASAKASSTSLPTISSGQPFSASAAAEAAFKRTESAMDVSAPINLFDVRAPAPLFPDSERPPSPKRKASSSPAEPAAKRPASPERIASTSRSELTEPPAPLFAEPWELLTRSSSSDAVPRHRQMSSDEVAELAKEVPSRSYVKATPPPAKASPLNAEQAVEPKAEPQLSPPKAQALEPSKSSDALRGSEIPARSGIHRHRHSSSDARPQLSNVSHRSASFTGESAQPLDGAEALSRSLDNTGKKTMSPNREAAMKRRELLERPTSLHLDSVPALEKAEDSSESPPRQVKARDVDQEAGRESANSANARSPATRRDLDKATQVTEAPSPEIVDASQSDIRKSAGPIESESKLRNPFQASASPERVLSRPAPVTDIPDSDLSKLTRVIDASRASDVSPRRPPVAPAADSGDKPPTPPAKDKRPALAVTVPLEPKVKEAVPDSPVSPQIRHLLEENSALLNFLEGPRSRQWPPEPEAMPKPGGEQRSSAPASENVPLTPAASTPTVSAAEKGKSPQSPQGSKAAPQKPPKPSGLTHSAAPSPTVSTPPRESSAGPTGPKLFSYTKPLVPQKLPFQPREPMGPPPVPAKDDSMQRPKPIRAGSDLIQLTPPGTAPSSPEQTFRVLPKEAGQGSSSTRSSIPPSSYQRSDDVQSELSRTLASRFGSLWPKSNASTSAQSPTVTASPVPPSPAARLGGSLSATPPVPRSLGSPSSGAVTSAEATPGSPTTPRQRVPPPIPPKSKRLSTTPQKAEEGSGTEGSSPTRRPAPAPPRPRRAPPPLPPRKDRLSPNRLGLAGDSAPTAPVASSPLASTAVAGSSISSASQRQEEAPPVTQEAEQAGSDTSHPPSLSSPARSPESGHASLTRTASGRPRGPRAPPPVPRRPWLSPSSSTTETPRLESFHSRNTSATTSGSHFFEDLPRRASNTSAAAAALTSGSTFMPVHSRNTSSISVSSPQDSRSHSRLASGTSPIPPPVPERPNSNTTNRDLRRNVLAPTPPAPQEPARPPSSDSLGSSIVSAWQRPGDSGSVTRSTSTAAVEGPEDDTLREPLTATHSQAHSQSAADLRAPSSSPQESAHALRPTQSHADLHPPSEQQRREEQRYSDLTDVDLYVARLQGSGREFEGLTHVETFLGPAVSPGASPEALATLVESPVVIDSRRVNAAGKVKLKMSVLGGRVTSCPVCMSQFRGGETALTLPNCGHVGHKSCVKEWMKRSHLCMVCRHPVGDEY